MSFTSQICTTKEQSERLLSLGLRKETADMCLHGTVDMSFTQSFSHLVKIVSYPIIPAWSLHRLLCLLPTEYIYDIDFQRIMQDFVFGSQDMYNEMISCIETLIEAGYFYEEYLEK